MKTADIKPFLKSTTAKLAATYLGIIMLMSIGFSIVLYQTSSQQLGRQLPPPSVYGSVNQYTGDVIIRTREESRQEVNRFLQDRIREGKKELIGQLIALNILVLLIGAALSYYLARRTLKPIEAVMQAQTQFVSDASHELRTPLTALQTTNEVALRKKKLTIAEAKDLIKHNVDETVKLKALSDALLGLLKQEQFPAPLTDVSIQSSVGHAMNMIVQNALDKNIAVEDNTANLMVRANEQSLSQVLTILLDNAIKYSDAETTIRINAEARHRQAVISITDQGIGIKAGDLPHIFRRFYRADKTRSTQNEHGYGLGLAIAEKLVHEQDGTITAASEPGIGTTFTITLPLSKNF